MEEEAKKDLSEKFDEIATAVSVPGVEWISGFLEGQFFIQARVQFEDSKGTIFNAIGNYTFPDPEDLDNFRRMLFLLRQIAVDAFQTLILNELLVSAHRPFSTRTF